jgi:hypothetical protein
VVLGIRPVRHADGVAGPGASGLSAKETTKSSWFSYRKPAQEASRIRLAAMDLDACQTKQLLAFTHITDRMSQHLEVKHA